MKRFHRSAAVLALLLALTAGCAPPAQETPATLYENDSAQMETAQLGQGLVELRYTGGAQVRVKAQITKEEGAPYNYDLNNAGDWETFSFSEGDGSYTVKVLENTTEDRYRAVFTATVTVALTNPMGPFLHPNQFVRYTPDGEAARLAGEVMADGETDADRAALAFDWVVDHITYDQDKLATLEGGYLPDVDAILREGTGICFDYAALLCVMLRSQGIPCKLVVGDAGKVYHAWVEVYCDSDGSIGDAIPITGGEWTLLDPTFVSANARSETILRYVSNRGNYNVRYIY